jgi:hypothetical protein
LQNLIFGTHSRPQIDPDLRALIQRMNIENALWGAPHIHGELLKLGFAVAQSTARHFVSKLPPPQAVVESPDAARIERTLAFASV